MATAQLKVLGNYFILPKENGGFQKSKKCEMLGWKCSIQPNETIICYNAQEAYDGWHIKRLIITKKGQVKIIEKLGENDKSRTVQKFYLTRKGEKLGIMNLLIGLSDGWVDGRKIYVRKGDLNNFMHSHGITAIHQANPNTLYSIQNKTCKTGDGYQYERLLTDGYCEATSTMDISNELMENSITKVKVTGATFVIKEQMQNLKYNLEKRTCVIFTRSKDITNMKLPVLVTE